MSHCEWREDYKDYRVSKQIEAERQDMLPTVFASKAGKPEEVYTEIAQDIFGLYVQIFGKPPRGDYPGQDYSDFHHWLDAIEHRGAELIKGDDLLRQFVANCRKDLQTATDDYKALARVADKKGWHILTTPYNPDTMRRDSYAAPGLSERARRAWRRVLRTGQRH